MKRFYKLYKLSLSAFLLGLTGCTIYKVEAPTTNLPSCQPEKQQTKAGRYE